MSILINLGDLFICLHLSCQNVRFLDNADRYAFLMNCVEKVKELGVMTDKEYCETQLKKKNEDFIEGRFLIHSMDYLVQTIL